MPNMKHILRLGAVAAVLLAGSCANNPDTTLLQDGAANHPITVAPHYRTLSLAAPGPNETLSPEDSARLDDFVANYRAHGNGSVSISAPAGPGAPAAIRYFGERLADLGVPRTHILVGTHALANGDSAVTIGYLTYTAHTAPCGDWTKNLGDTASNAPPPDFGCAVQHNIAAMVADPHDLLGPRPMGRADATRRATIMDKYEKGEPTAATKTSDQSGDVSQTQ